MLRLRLFLTVSFLFAAANLYAQKGIQFRELSFQEALKASAKENKPVFLHAYASWCHFCDYMRDSVYTSEAAGEYFNAKFINIRIDMEKEGKELNRRLRVSNFPGLIVIDSTGITLHRISGKKDTQDFLQFGKEALDPEKRLLTYENKFRNGQSNPQEAYHYFYLLKRAGLDNQPFINAYFSKIPDQHFVKPEYWRILYDQYTDVEKPLMQRFVNMRDELSAVYTADSVENRIITSYINSLMAKVQKLDSAGYYEQVKKLRAAGDSLFFKITDFADLNRLKLTSMWKEYCVYAVPFVQTYCMNDHRRLNEIAYNFSERATDKTQLGLAVQWAKRSVELSDNYRNNQTLAALYYKTGKKQEALSAAEHALTVAKAGTDTKPTRLLLEKIREMP